MGKKKKDKYLGMSSEQVIYRVSRVSIASNALLSALKLAAGIVGHSAAMVSDACHSASDVLGTLIVIIGAHFSGKKPDKDHPYGHERLECVASLLLSDILAVIGVAIGYAGIRKLMHPEDIVIPTMLPLIIAVVSIVTKELLYQYTIHAAKRINSVSLKAEAWHHRSDALSSIGSFAGILGARLGYPVLDPVASIIIAVFILKVSVDIFRETIDKLVDKKGPDEFEDRLTQEILSVDGVMHIDSFQTRQFGSKMYADIEITADGTLPLYEAHKIASRVHRLLEESNPELKHCTVHVNPDEELQHDW